MDTNIVSWIRHASIHWHSQTLFSCRTCVNYLQSKISPQVRSCSIVFGLRIIDCWVLSKNPVILSPRTSTSTSQTNIYVIYLFHLILVGQVAARTEHRAHQCSQYVIPPRFLLLRIWNGSNLNLIHDFENIIIIRFRTRRFWIGVRRDQECNSDERKA